MGGGAGGGLLAVRGEGQGDRAPEGETGTQVARAALVQAELRMGGEPAREQAGAGEARLQREAGLQMARALLGDGELRMGAQALDRALVSINY